MPVFKQYLFFAGRWRTVIPGTSVSVLGDTDKGHGHQFQPRMNSIEGEISLAPTEYECLGYPDILQHLLLFGGLLS